MRTIGWAFLIGGFLWIVYDLYSGSIAEQHTRLIWLSQILSNGDLIERGVAEEALRESSLDIEHQHRLLIRPSVMMLMGGVIMGFFPRNSGIRPREKARVISIAHWKPWHYPIAIVILTVVIFPFSAMFYTPAGYRARVMFPGVVLALLMTIINVFFFSRCPKKPYWAKVLTLVLLIPSLFYAADCVMSLIAFSP